MKSILKNIVKAIILTLLLVGCAPKAHVVSVQYEEPPRFSDVVGIKRIVVIPFTAPSGTLYSEMAIHATAQARSAISGLSQFSIVDYSQIEHIKNSQSIDDYVDAKLVGEIINIDTSTKNEQKERNNRVKGSDGKYTTIKVPYTEYITNVEITYSYQLVKVRDGSIVGERIQRTQKVSDKNENRYPDAKPLLKKAIEFSDFRTNYVAHPVSARRTFATEEKSKDKELKLEMRAAMEQAKAGSRKQAIQSYLDIYKQNKNIAAALNVATLYEASGDVQAAVDFMQQVYQETGNPQAQERLSDMNRYVQNTAMASKHRLIAAENPTERIATFAIEEVLKFLPKDKKPKVWIHNDSQGNNTSEIFVDKMTADFIQKGISVVERQHTALFFGEQELQVSGVVRDNDIVNIGNAAGANTIVLISVVGQGANRRLNVKVLDVEKGEPIYQSSPTDEIWRL